MTGVMRQLSSIRDDKDLVPGIEFLHAMHLSVCSVCLHTPVPYPDLVRISWAAACRWEQPDTAVHPTGLLAHTATVTGRNKLMVRSDDTDNHTLWQQSCSTVL
jgi:hypothetical protein